MAIKSYKGMDKNMRCLGFQYKNGETYETDKADVCNFGFHACESPLDVFGYYPPCDSRYFEVEQDGELSKGGNDSKVASTRIKIGAEIGIPGLVRAHIDFVKSRTTTEHTDPGRATAGDFGAATAGNGGAATAGNGGAATAGDFGAATAGNSGAATAGDFGAATAGYRGAATAGYRGAATAGNGGAATARGSVSVGENGCGLVRGNNIKARGGLGAILVICIEKEHSYNIKEWKASVVDGVNLKPDVWYTLKDGEFVEAEE